MDAILIPSESALSSDQENRFKSVKCETYLHTGLRLYSSAPGVLHGVKLALMDVILIPSESALSSDQENRLKIVHDQTR